MDEINIMNAQIGTNVRYFWIMCDNVRFQRDAVLKKVWLAKNICTVLGKRFKDLGLKILNVVLRCMNIDKIEYIPCKGLCLKNPIQNIEIFVEKRICIISKWDHLDLNVLISILMTQIFAYIVKVEFVINHLKTILSAKWHWLFLIYIIICRVDLNLWVKKPQSEHNEKLNLNKSHHWTIFKRWNK